MTEQEWLTCTDPKPMLQFLRGKASQRKMRLIACACCRRVWDLLTDERSRTAVELAEQFADGRAGKQELIDAHRAAIGAHVEWCRTEDTWRTFAMRAAAFAAASNNFAVDAMAPKVANDAAHGLLPDSRLSEEEGQCQLLRDLFGNPFRPVPFDPAWRTPSITDLARAIYDQRRFKDMPVLAGALEESSCTSPELMAHCRSGEEHFKGCWAVDAILDKT